MTTQPTRLAPEELARQFHDAYERLAPSFGYETRADTKQFDPESKNGRLMIAVCDVILRDLLAALDAAKAELAEAKKRHLAQLSTIGDQDVMNGQIRKLAEDNHRAQLTASQNQVSALREALQTLYNAAQWKTGHEIAQFRLDKAKAALAATTPEAVP